MRGEKFSAGILKPSNLGSPPHTLGKGAKGAEDHPRMRGEKAVSLLRRDYAVGSPPHARGKEKQQPEPKRQTGITPACAGKSRAGEAGQGPIRDHPRIRGEKHQCAALHQPLTGSPPHARGKEKDGPNVVARRRITPACAGKSNAGDITSGKARITPACAGKRNPRRYSRAQSRDHPRIRGEKA